MHHHARHGSRAPEHRLLLFGCWRRSTILNPTTQELERDELPMFRNLAQPGSAGWFEPRVRIEAARKEADVLKTEADTELVREAVKISRTIRRTVERVAR